MQFEASVCWVCLARTNVKYTRVLEIYNQNYIIEDGTFKVDVIPTPVYQCICEHCGANGIDDPIVSFTNDLIILCFSEYMLDNEPYFIRRYNERKTI